MAIQFPVNPRAIILDGDLLESVTAFEEYVRNSIDDLHAVDSCIVAFDAEGNIRAFLFGFCKPNTVTKEITYVYAHVDVDKLVKTRNHLSAVTLIKSAGTRIEVYVTWIVTDRYVKIGS